MSDSKIPAPLCAIITEKIDSIGQLEILVLLSKEPGKKWEAAGVSAQLQSNENLVAKQLETLCEKGLLSCQSGTPPHYWFPPGDERVAEALKSLAALYPQFQHRFIELIYDKPRERIRALLDSFKIGGGNKDG